MSTTRLAQFVGGPLDGEKTTQRMPILNLQQSGYHPITGVRGRHVYRLYTDDTYRYEGPRIVAYGAAGQQPEPAQIAPDRRRR